MLESIDDDTRRGRVNRELLKLKLNQKDKTGGQIQTK